MHSKIRDTRGFTLLELLMVLMVMGFFIAMMIPRLGGLMGTAIDTTCDTNNKDARYWVRAYQQEHNDRLPNRLVNIMIDDDIANLGDEGLPAFDNNDPEDGPEVLSWEFVNRNKPYTHYIDTNEALELRQLGIGTVAMLNDYTQDDGVHSTNATPMMFTSVASGLGVMMVGAGVDSAGAWQVGFSAGNNFAGYNQAAAGEAVNYSRNPASPEAPWDTGHGNPYWMYRMVFGLGPDCSLVADGYTQRAALCPGGIQNSDNVNYNYYTLIVPRLKSTVDRITIGTEPGLIAVADHEGSGDQKFWNLAYDPDSPPAGGAGTEWDTAAANCASWQGATDGTETPHVFAGNGHGVQENWEFDFTCPEGHKWPDNENEMWDVGADI